MNFALKVGKDSIARRIVMRRTTWDRLVEIAEALAEMRDVDVAPADVARIALEAGLAEVEKGLSAPSKPKRKAKTKARSKGKSGSGRRPRGAVVKLSQEQEEELKAILLNEHTVRHRQRAIALWFGLSHKKMDQEKLRQLMLAHEAYNVANFAQNMKKDAELFEEIKNEDGRRFGWKLTRAGRKTAKALVEEALTAV